MGVFDSWNPRSLRGKLRPECRPRYNKERGLLGAIMIDEAHVDHIALQAVLIDLMSPRTRGETMLDYLGIGLFINAA